MGSLMGIDWIGAVTMTHIDCGRNDRLVPKISYFTSCLEISFIKIYIIATTYSWLPTRSQCMPLDAGFSCVALGSWLEYPFYLS